MAYREAMPLGQRCRGISFLRTALTLIQWGSEGEIAQGENPHKKEE